MTRVDFYILRRCGENERYRVACRIAEKAFGNGHTVHIHTGSGEACRRLDELLWTFRDRSFVPHAVAPQEPGAWPVTIGHETEPDPRDVLVNLDNGVPVFFSRFERVAEIVDQEEPCRTLGRERYRFYRERGYPLHHHNLNP